MRQEREPQQKEGPEYGRKKKMDVTGMLPVERPYRGKISINREQVRRKHLVKKRMVFALKGICLIVLLFAALFPVYWLVLMAIRPTAETSMGAGLIPHQITGEHFTELFVGKGFGTALKNSLINAVSALVMSLVLGLTTAYIISRKRFRFGMKKPLTYWVLLVRVLPPVAFVIPLYTLFTKWNLMGTRLPIILSCMLVNIPLVIWFMVSFFEELPEEVEESGKVDGATEWQLFTRLVLPLVLPGVAAISMLSFMYAWNEYTYSVILTRSPANYTIPLALAVLNTEDNVTNFGLVAAGGVSSFLPVALFVVFAQNYLISGLSSGAVKE